MNLSKRIEKLEKSNNGAAMHIYPWQVNVESEEEAEARYCRTTGASIGSRDLVVVLQRFGDGPEAGA